MRAVVMAGGEGTRLRPLTSNQPKPMVPICGKPCIEHIVELVHKHGIDDVVVTLAFMPQVIRSYLGDGSSLGVRIEYAVEEQPLGTAGSVRNAKELLDETFVVISGDALCDFDIGEIVRFHRERGALATLALKSVDNPLEFGVVIVDDEGRIERFLEKPSWGQVFSDTINTGVYVHRAGAARPHPGGRALRLLEAAVPRAAGRGRAAVRLRRSGGQVLEGHRDDRAVPGGEPGRARRPRRRRRPGRAPEGEHLARRGRDAARCRRDHRPRVPRCVHDGRGGRDRRAVRGARRERHGQGRRVGPALRDRRRHAHRSLRGRPRRDRRAQLRPAGARPRRRGRGPRRRVRRRRGGADRARGAGVPVQDDRGRRPDPAEPRVGVPRRAVAVLARRRRRHDQRRRDARGRGAARHGVRDAAGARLDRGRLARRPSGGTDDHEGDGLRPGVDRRARRRPAHRVARARAPLRQARTARRRLPRARGAARPGERRDHVPRVVRAARGRGRAARDRARVRAPGVPREPRSRHSGARAGLRTRSSATPMGSWRRSMPRPSARARSGWSSTTAAARPRRPCRA